MKIAERKLKELGLELPAPAESGANYVPFARVDDLLFLGGVVSTLGKGLRYRGRVGEEVTIEEAYQVARLCALKHLSVVRQALGDLDKVKRIVRVVGYVNSAPWFAEQGRVIDGESDLLVQVYGELGRHVRCALGVSQLPFNAPVETELLVHI